MVIKRSLAAPDAFSRIFDRHFDAIYAYLARRIGRGRAEDLAASTFTVAFERRARFRTDTASARPWLLGIATNLLRNEWRAEKRGANLLTRLSGGLAAAHGGTGESAEPLGRLLAQLDPDQLDVLLLYAWEELSYEEIAAALGIPVGTVRSRLSRARAHLRDGLDREGSGGSAAREARR